MIVDQRTCDCDCGSGHMHVIVMELSCLIELVHNDIMHSIICIRIGYAYMYTVDVRFKVYM